MCSGPRGRVRPRPSARRTGVGGTTFFGTRFPLPFPLPFARPPDAVTGSDSDALAVAVVASLVAARFDSSSVRAARVRVPSTPPAP